MYNLKDSNTTNVVSFNEKISEKVCHRSKGPTDSLQKVEKLENNKHDVHQSPEINIRNIRKTKCLPIKFQKLMIPRKNTKLSYHFIKKNNNSSNILSVRRNSNIKNVLDDSHKVAVQSEFIQALAEEKYTVDKIRFGNISKVSILLLYLHFLLCYYLSFSKTSHFVELFEMCPAKNNGD
ncbi:uncharacterized protein LOC122570857 [Bombus pyrosoma]|uniref:uncharacterized protein LOC122570857 n=1 Tax=Bombus pyrosoma TaxID=396416 RepID=UPI001CB93111|nr:uncharacterized protein LOC122570857 [Bombus pyrosoma]